MSYDKFELLVQDFCKIVGLSAPNTVTQGDPILVDDVICVFNYSPTYFPDRVFIYVDYGALPKGKEKEASIALLRDNHARYTGDGQIFGCVPDSEHIVMSDHIDLHSQSGESVALRISAVVASVKKWRKDFFLPNQIQSHSVNSLTRSMGEKISAYHESAISQKIRNLS